MDSDWREEEILITVRAYPEPSAKYAETSCVAGITQEGKPIRIFPIPARHLADANQFKKWNVIRAKVKKAATDTRPESHYIDIDSILPIGEVKPSGGWKMRHPLIEPWRVAKSIEELQAQYEITGRSETPSLALIRPAEITKFSIVPKSNTDWPEAKKQNLARLTLFEDRERDLLEFIPLQFQYDFRCDDDRCTGHTFSVIDWEIAQAYRRWRKDYPPDVWESKFRQQFEEKFLDPSRIDLQFFVGTMSSHPKTWTIIGLYYPPPV